MAKYERVPGGEKTEKTGVKWSREELQACLDIYGECRESIHERNPRIQELAKSLGRSVRSVENQLLMFRAIEKAEEGDKYSRDRMNKLCLELWKEKKMNYTENSSDSSGGNKPDNESSLISNNDKKVYYLFPEDKWEGPYSINEINSRLEDGTLKGADFIGNESWGNYATIENWKSVGADQNNERTILNLILNRSRGGKDSATDLGDDTFLLPHTDPPPAVLETIKLLVDATKSHSQNEKTFLFLVGGPGNGKSFQANQVLKDLNLSYEKIGPPGSLAKRKRIINSGEGLANCPLTIVNDATIRDEADPSCQLTRELDLHINASDTPHNLMVNINRGILLEELILTKNKGTYPYAQELIDWISQDDPDEADGDKGNILNEKHDFGFYKHCKFTLQGNEKPINEASVHVVYLDRLSIFEPTPTKKIGFDWERYRVLQDFGNHARLDTIAGKLLCNVIDKIVPEDLYEDPHVKDLCPIVANIKSLQNKQVCIGVLDVFRAAEIASGRLFTIRDLWGLICQVIIGGNRPEFERSHPCEVVSRIIKKDKLEELIQWRFYNSIFQNEDSPSYTPEIKLIKMADPASDLGPWSIYVDEAMEMISFEETPSSSKSLSAKQDFSNCWLNIDREIEKIYYKSARPDAKGNEANKRRILRSLGLSLYRLIGIIDSFPAHRDSLLEWLKLRNYPEKDHENLPLPEDSILRKGLDKLIMPIADQLGLPNASLLPLFRSRITPINEPLLEPEICIKVSSMSGTTPILWETMHIGDMLWIRIISKGKQLAAIHIDNAICREALIAANGRGFTEFGANSIPRLERTRAALTVESDDRPLNPVLVHSKLAGITLT